MHFETAQVIDLVGITKEALRHWKTVLPPISGRDGRSGGYTFAEVLALALIAEAHRELDVPVSRFRDVAHRFFAEVFPVASHAKANDVVVSITRGDIGVHSLVDLPPASAMALLRIDPILQRLRKRLSGAWREPEEAQMSLNLVAPEPVLIKRSGARLLPPPLPTNKSRASKAGKPKKPRYSQQSPK